MRNKEDININNVNEISIIYDYNKSNYININVDYKEEVKKKNRRNYI